MLKCWTLKISHNFVSVHSKRSTFEWIDFARSQVTRVAGHEMSTIEIRGQSDIRFARQRMKSVVTRNLGVLKVRITRGMVNLWRKREKERGRKTLTRRRFVILIG